MGTDDEIFDQLIYNLKEQGFNEPADNLNELLHQIAWTSSSEMLGELGLEILRTEKKYKNRLDPKTSKAVKSCLRVVRKVWPSIKI